MSSDGPKSFKEMIFPPSRDGAKNAIAAPLPPSVPARTISPSEAERRASQLKVMKDFINAERCSICQAQLDGSIGYDWADLYCRANEKEYKAHYKYGSDQCILQWSKATFYTTHFAFEIVSRHIDNELYENSIFKIDLSLNERFQQMTKENFVTFEGQRFIFNGKLTEQQLLNKIKLYTVFS